MEPGPELEAWQRELLEGQAVGRLATNGPGGRPHLVPVCYALTAGEVVVAVDEKPKRPGRLARLRNIDRDARATLLVDRYDDAWEDLAWVRLDCDARVVERGGDRPAALAALRARYPRYWPMALEVLPLIVLRPIRVAGWRWRQDEARRPLP